MPNAIPAGAAAPLPPARMIDPRGHRFGAGLSAILLVASFAAGWVPARVPRPALDRDERRVRPPVLDLRRDLAPDRPDRPARQGRARARVPAALRPDARQRRADPVAARVRVGCDDARLGASRSPSPGCRALLALTGYCLGCRLYFLRWWVPSVATSHLDARPRHDSPRKRSGVRSPRAERDRVYGSIGSAERYGPVTRTSPSSTGWSPGARIR